MILLSKLADYAVIVATYLAEAAPAQVNAMHLAAETRLPPATVAKLLKLLARAGIVTAVRGAAGGYRLARPADEVSIAAVAPALTQCAGHVSPCDRLHFCPTRPHWQRINQAVGQALEAISLGEMASSRPAPPMLDFTRHAPLEATAP
jgi:Rrf2 family protein